ncbi:MAG: DUF2179 domain-containing protein [Calditrichota bacterium]
MEIFNSIDPGLRTWVVIPVLIFIARILDVSIGTVRVIFVARGMKILAPVLGFFEVLIWLLAIGQILQNLTNWQNYLAYASGFATGNFVGMVLEGRLALGTAILRVITRTDAEDLVAHLREENYGVTSLSAQGKYGPVKVLFMLVARNDLPRAIELINRFHPHAFYSVEDVRYVNEGVFPPRRGILKERYLSVWEIFRKTK